jgi:Rubrerythrin
VLRLQGPARKIFVEFLERSCTAEFSGFLLYKELGRRLKKTNPVVAEVGDAISRLQIQILIATQGAGPAAQEALNPWWPRWPKITTPAPVLGRLGLAVDERLFSLHGSASCMPSHEAT